MKVVVAGGVGPLVAMTWLTAALREVADHYTPTDHNEQRVEISAGTEAAVR